MSGAPDGPCVPHPGLAAIAGGIASQTYNSGAVGVDFQANPRPAAPER